MPDIADYLYFTGIIVEIDEEKELKKLRSIFSQFDIKLDRNIIPPVRLYSNDGEDFRTDSNMPVKKMDNATPVITVDSFGLCMKHSFGYVLS